MRMDNTGETDDREFSNAEDLAAADQVKVILDSASFRNAPALRRLLKFLMEKHLAGESEGLKEYSVGVDALGKPESFDPKKDSIVRLQMGRLRQKLAEYGRTEGSDDPYIIELPKGTFAIRCSERLPAPPPPPEPRDSRSRRYLNRALIASLLWSIAAAVWLWRDHHKPAGVQNLWAPALDVLWRPMLNSQRSLVIAIEEPPFAQIAGFGVYRELRLNNWKDIEQSPDVAAIRKALDSPSISPNYYYAPMGEVTAAFLLGRLLGPRVPGLSLIGSRELSWRQIGNSDVIYLGISGFVADIVRGLPVQPDLAEVSGGISNSRPRAGESAFYRDQLPGGPAEDGEAYALITHLPGPAGTGTFTTFTGSSTASRLAAVQYFTDSRHADTLLGKMKLRTGGFPDFYQVLLRVKFKDGVPTRTSLVLSHELRF